MKNYTLLICFPLLLSLSCKSPVISDESSLDNELDTFEIYFVEEIFKLWPSLAISAGRHDFDSLLPVPSRAAIEKENARLRQLLDSLKNYDEKRLNPSNRTDLRMMRDQLEAGLWYNNEFRPYEWNPARLNALGEFAEIMNGSYAPLDDRLRSIHRRLYHLPAFYMEGRKLITTPTMEHTSLALLQHEGSLDEVFGSAFKDSVNSSTLQETEKASMLQLVDSARASIAEHIQWLKSKLTSLNDSTARNFRIGKALYEEKFKHDIVSGFAAEEIYNKAVARRAELHSEMAQLSRSLWARYFRNEEQPADSLVLIRRMIDRLSVNHVHPDSFLQAIEKQIPELTEFIREKDLLYIDPSKPLVVRRTPAYMEGSGAGASISAPGPFDKTGNTYYNVSPLTGYTKEQAESYLREYNHYILQILNIHEAIPGHYTQLVYSNNSPSLIKSLFGNGAMVEGWAVYTERMMLENGYGGNAPEMWLMYYKWHLRSVCNTILDYSVHVLNMSEEEARKLLIDGAFQQQAEADGKWRRVKLSQVQLCSYFTGYTEIYELRETLKQKQGDAFNLKKFHEEFLSYGSAPVKYIRELMLEK